MGKIIVYGEMAQRIGKREIDFPTEGRTLISVLRDFADKYGVKDLLFKGDKIRPIYLILVNGSDYLSLGFLNKVLDKDVEIKLVPTFHGG